MKKIGNNLPVVGIMWYYNVKQVKLSLEGEFMKDEKSEIRNILLGIMILNLIVLVLPLIFLVIFDL